MLIATLSLWVIGGVKPASADSWGLVLQNDVVAGTDRHLTSSIGFEWVSDEMKSQADGSFQKQYTGFLTSFFEQIPMVELDQKSLAAGINIYQDIVTPSNISRKELIRDDLPYAGYLHSTFSLTGQHQNLLENFRLSVGMVGPVAYGEETQKAFHKLINNKEPKGWDNQLDNQMTMGIGYSRGYRMREWSDRNNLKSRWGNMISMDLGNYYTGITLGSIYQFGFNFPDNPILITSTSNNQSQIRFQSDRKSTGFGWTAICGIYASALGYVYYLDASPDHDLEYDRLVGHGSIGIMISYRQLLVSFTFRSMRVSLNEGIQNEAWGVLSINFI